MQHISLHIEPILIHGYEYPCNEPMVWNETDC